jgi:nucleotide-binding universal stress UspA family protein
MTPPILVGVDPLRHDPEAAVLAALLARSLHAPVVAAAIYPLEPLRYGGGEAYERELRGTALARLNAVEAAFHGVELETVAIAGTSAARALHGLAEERGAGLLVVGSTHHGVSGRISLGSTADRLLHGATCPIAVAPLGFADRLHGLDRIGVAFADSEEGLEAVRAAAALASACHADLHAATAVEPTAWSATSLADPSNVDGYLGELRDLAASRLRAALEGVQPGIRTHSRVLINSPVTALEQFSHDVDLLVCGSRGYGALGSVLLGGVSRRLIHRAAGPVIVVPRGSQRVLQELAGIGEATHA